MKLARLLINWYKPSGKWYAQDLMSIPSWISVLDDEFIDYIETNQEQLVKDWVDGNWYVSISCIEQDNEDTRFFERLVKYPRSNNA